MLNIFLVRAKINYVSGSWSLVRETVKSNKTAYT